MSLTFKSLSVGDNVKSNNGVVFRILTISADDTDFTPTPSLVYTLSNDGTYYIVGTGFDSISSIEADESGGTAGSGLDNTWSGGDLYIPNKYNGLPVKAIAPKSFTDITNITNCYIQEGLTHIGHRAFQRKNDTIRTHQLSLIELPKSLAFLGGSGGRVFWKNDSLISCDIKNLNTLDLNTFYDCISLQNVVGLYCKSVGRSAFYRNNSLQSVELPLCESVGESAFGYCSSLQNINLPLCESIDKTAFYECSSLQKAIIPKIKSIGSYGLRCEKLNLIVIKQNETICTIQSDSLPNAHSQIHAYLSIYVPDNLVNSYQNATNWANYRLCIKPLSEYVE